MSSEPNSGKKRALQPPPNYSSRKMQLRLFALVVAFMGVIYLVTEAAKPATWNWFFGRPNAEVAEEVPPQVDTRLPDAEQPSQQDSDVVKIIDPYRGSLDDRTALEANDPVARALADGWSAFFEQTSRDEHDLVAKALINAAQQQGFALEDATAWNEFLEKADGFWEGYRQNALKALEASHAEDEAAPPVDEAEKKVWVGVLDQVRDAWRADRAALARLSHVGEVPFTDEERQRLNRWQLRWERLGLAAIKDDMVHRPQEGDAWFRLLDVLNRTSQAQLEKQPAERVNYVQLYKETDTYRGKLVRFSGRIKQVKPIRASQNVYGIENLYLIWIKPDDGPKTPVVVYALEMPKGFPGLDTPDLNDGYSKYRDGEDVIVTGYLFKRWAYRAIEGTHTAPLVLTKSVEWIPSPVVTRGDELPSTGVFLSWVAGSALLAVMVAAFIYYRTKAVSPAIESFQNSPAAQEELHQSLTTADAGPSTLEALRMMEERDQQGEGKST